ncbi:uncharacterized protein LOC112589140 [Harpegnathos saltator]|uniref:uncharacterized protein LOC105191221 n=1 Tax=Harpegnathos saltator TaxID=610380 RepID=UPI0005906029|nr:uncharacterized protein LOC105191221 [Harpegnathos saltator]XP_025157067.1 uncharacterized protein LOC112589140 [Harpegnathos saltator]
MTTAPVVFTSNMTETEIEGKHELAFNILSTNNNLKIFDTNKEYFTSDENDIRIVDSQDKDNFALNAICININENKLDNINGEHSTNDESNVKIVDSQEILPLKNCNKESIHSSIDIQRKKRKCINQELINSPDEEENCNV